MVCMTKISITTLIMERKFDVPAEKVFGVVPSVEIIVRDIEVTGAGVIGEDAQVHVFEAAFFTVRPLEPAMNWVPAQIPTVFRMVTPSK